MIRKARFRGTWYPYSAEEAEAITGPLSSSGNARIAVLPHAGLCYSGALIRYFFERIPYDTEKALILSPSHYFMIPAGTAAIAPFTESETPFGLLRTLMPEIPGSLISCEAIAAEHGLEMFLPFIGRKGGIAVTYMIISSLRSPEEAASAARRIAELMNGRTILIASSDFTHYGRRFGYTPYGSNVLEKTMEHDSRAAAMLSESDGIGAYREFRKSTICGIASAAIAAETAAILELKGETGPWSTSLGNGDNAETDDFVSYRTVLWRDS